jgi:hypothetical protein
MSRAPKINTDNSAFQDNSGANSETVGGEQQDLLSLLNEASDELNLDNESDLFGANDNTTGNDNSPVALLNKNDDNIDTNQPAESDEDDTDVLLRLLGNDDEAKYSEDQPKELIVPEYGESGAQVAAASTQDSTLIVDLKNKIAVFEQTLEERTTEKENLEREINNYDLQIAELENSSSNSYDRSITRAAYSVEVMLSEFKNSLKMKK